MGIYYYSSVILISELLKLTDFKKIIIPLGFLSLVFTDIVYPDVFYEIKWDATVWVAYITTFGVILPIALFLVSLIKKLFIKTI